MTEGFEEEKHYSEYMEQCVLPAIVQLAVAVRVLRCVISSPAITHSLARLLACLLGACLPACLLPRSFAEYLH